MRFISTSLQDAYLIEHELLEDERGFFARSFCQQEFLQKGLNPNLVQCNLSFNKKKGTIRGMHYQLAPGAEAKCVRCIKGSIFDVIIDLRSQSSTYKKWQSFLLNEENRQILYVPEGFAHGFQTLTDNAELFYQMSSNFVPHLARGIRWDDPAFSIPWPISSFILSEKDRSYPDFPI
jgi:dTDP-4-dehydrorhamnose 3,5-epimerase